MRTFLIWKYSGVEPKNQLQQQISTNTINQHTTSPPHLIHNPNLIHIVCEFCKYSFLNKNFLVKQAEAEAKAITLKSEAEAMSIQKKGDALRRNPEIINLINSEKWDGKLPVTMLPSSTVPMVNIQSQ